MNVLVTGGAGFIGSNFVRLAITEHPEWVITVLDSLTYAGSKRNLEGLPEDRLHFIEGDITDEDLVGQVMQGKDIVVHFAAETHVDRSVSGPLTFVRTNVMGTQILLDAARRVGVKRFHHVSTDEVFGSLELDGDKFRETTPYDPRSPYAASKAASDHLVRAAFHTYGLPVTISNCTNNYGPYQYPEKLIPVMVLKALAGEKLPVYGDGLNVRDWIHVDDHNRGVLAILERGVLGETYCLGGEAERDNLTLVKTILKELGLGEDMIMFVQDRPGHDRRYAMDISHAKQELGWSPQVSFEQGIAQTVAWYKQRADQLVTDEQGVHAKVA
jgi:dTDP-glucose 4,6-dehydratase